MILVGVLGNLKVMSISRPVKTIRVIWSISFSIYIYPVAKASRHYEIQNKVGEQLIRIKKVNE